MTAHTFWHKIAIILALVVMFASAQAHAAQRHSHVQIFPQSGTINPGDEITIATQIDLAGHWHVYWRNPGDSGYPVTINWRLPEGFEVSKTNWPTPEKIFYDDLASYGYFDHVTLLQTLKVPKVLPKGKIALTAGLELLVCNNICIPEEEEITIYLNDPAATNIDNSAKIAAAKTKLPQAITGQFHFHEDKENGLLHFSLTPDDGNVIARNAGFFPYEPGIIDNASAPKVAINEGKLTLSYKRGYNDLPAGEAVEGLLVTKNTGYVIKATPSDNIETSPTAENLTFIGALALAFLGGLALNLMPCVFPVLSIKALSLAKMKGHEIAQARLHGIAYALGVIISFVIIAATLIALKQAGAAIGWGFQLQNPVVVAALACLLFLIGLNLAGIFEFSFGLNNIGAKFTQGRSYAASFLTGALACVVATPCTAPFMGAAMGFALTQSAPVALSIFAVLGLGMALPYLALAVIPQATAILPKPGQWMVTFRKILSIPMFASALWLFWVLSQQTGALTPRIHHATPYSKAALSELLEGDDPVFVEMSASWCITCKLNHAVAIETKSTKGLFADKHVHHVIGDWTNRNAEITEYLGTFGRNGVPLYVYYPPRESNTTARPQAILLPQILTSGTLHEAITNKF